MSLSGWPCRMVTDNRGIVTKRLGCLIALTIWSLGFGFLPDRSLAGADDPASAGVLLDSGRIESAEWRVLVKRDDGSGGNRRPCLEVSVFPDPDRGPSHRSVAPMVGSTACREVRSTPVVLAVKNEVMQPPVAVLALAFSQRVHRVRLTLGDGSVRTVRLTVLSTYKLERANIAPFKYAVVAFSGEFCLKGFEAFARDGELEQSGKVPCAHPA